MPRRADAGGDRDQPGREEDELSNPGLSAMGSPSAAAAAVVAFFRAL